MNETQHTYVNAK